MDWNSVHPDERIRLWKNFRKSIDSHEIHVQLNEIAEFFTYIPIGPRTLDFYTPSSWSTPWEMLYDNKWCVCSTSLLIFYTIDLLPVFQSISNELILVDDNIDRYLLPLIDNQFVLNYHLGKVSKIQDIKDDFKILEVYSKNNIKKIK